MALRVEPEYPVPDDLQTNAADLDRLCAGRSIQQMARVA